MRFFWPTLILGIIGIVAACGGDDSSSSSTSGAKVNVVATTVQITALAREVGGDKIEVKGIIPVGADPHEFEPVASDLQAIEDADVILRHGMELDDWMNDTLSAGHKDATTVTEGIVPLTADEDGKTVDDPHVWHDPDNDKIMVDNIAKALDAADPADKAAFDANATAYKQKLDATKTQVQSIIDEIPADSRKLVTDHDAFGYFAHAFGMQIIGAVIPSVSTDAEASAQQTADLLDTIEREHVKAIFSEQSANPKLAQTLASDANVKIVDTLYGDSLGKPGSGADTVDGMLLSNAHQIADALK